MATVALLEHFTSVACPENRLASGLGEHEPRRSPSGLIFCVRCGMVAPVEPAAVAVSREPARRAAVLTPSVLPDAEAHGSCRYCRSPLSESSRTREHLTPRSRGGAKSGRNVAASCYFCNSIKGPLTDGEFLVWLETGRIERSVPACAVSALRRAEERGLRVLLLRARLADRLGT